MKYRNSPRTGLAVLTIVCSAVTVEAKITRIVIEQRESPAFNGQAFGRAGMYETLRGHFFGELDPKDPHNTIITDLRFAPKNARGMVEYSGTFAISKPVDLSKSNNVLLYSVVNRGTGTTAGSTDGQISVVSGWQGDVAARANAQTLTVPVAKNLDGSSLTGPVLARFVNMAANTNTLALTAAVGSLAYQRPLSLDTSKATLSMLASEGAKGMPVPGSDWAFADCAAAPFPGTPDPSKICVKAGFDPKYLYELVFTAKDPLVLGIGYAATRDLNSFLRYADKDDAGTANPVAKAVKWAISQGNSQSGNFIRSFIHLGFNQDEAGRIVWDGANPNIAGRQLAMNFRFAVAGGNANPDEPGSEAVLCWNKYTDQTRGRPAASMLDRCTATRTCPKIFETFGGVEFWQLRMSPNLVGTDAKADIPLPSNVRRYYSPGTTHGGGRGGFSTAAPAIPNGCLLPGNPNPETETLRALTVTLVDWVTKGTEPPASVYPRIDNKQLVQPTRAAMGYPNIPGAPSPDGVINPLPDYDFGAGFHANDLSGVISVETSGVKKKIPLLVPKADADGMDVGGIPSVLRQAPLGTYLSWNVTAGGFNQGRMCALNGGYIPFAKTKADRLQSGDPRLSLEERYTNHDGYVAAVKAAAEKLVGQRFLLQEDADKLIAQAAASDVLVAEVETGNRNENTFARRRLRRRSGGQCLGRDGLRSCVP